MTDEKPTQRISNEVAEDELSRFLDYYDLDPAEDEDAAELINRYGKRLRRAIRNGYLELEEDDSGRLFVLQNLRCKHKKLGDTLRFKPLSAKAKLAMKDGMTANRKGELQQQGTNQRMYRMLASLAGVEFSTIQLVEGPDVGLMEILGALFLLV
jgi:hypothetical protein